MMYAGVDIGSVTTKAVIINEQKEILAVAKSQTTHDRAKSGKEVLNSALSLINAHKSNVQYTISTGYGRRVFTSEETLPEIICHAKGTIALFPDAMTIIDIGGQDSKIIELGENGWVLRFEMNDKCAAGTGRFLEVLTDRILNLELDELGPLSLKCSTPCVISSMCTVFAETEIISFLSENRLKEDIIGGMHNAIAKRVIAMGINGQIAFNDPVIFSGGVARNIGVIKSIEKELKKKVVIPEDPQVTAALGAAIYAKERSDKNTTGNADWKKENEFNRG